MATYSTVWAWIIPTAPRAKKVFTEREAKKIAAQTGLAWSRVVKRKAGVRAQVRRRGHPPQSKTFATKGQAETWATRVEAAMSSGTFRDLSVARGMTVAALLDSYATGRTLDSSETARIKHLQAKPLGDITLDQLHAAHCLDYVDRRRGTREQRLAHYARRLSRQVAAGYEDPDDAEDLLADARDGDMVLPGRVSDATLTRDLDVLGSAIAWAKAHKKLHLVEHAVRDAKAKLVVHNERNRRPTDAELQGIFAASDSPELRPIIEVAVETAMRRGELSTVRIEDIQWEKQTARLRREKADRLKKSRQVGREVPLTAVAVNVLRAQIGDRTHGYVFTLAPNSITQAFRRACERAGIRDLVFHDLRHHALSNWAERGLTIYELQQIGGHRDVRSLQRYIHEKADRVARRMDAARVSGDPTEPAL